jgi:SAM-dependent methyltransferase
MTYKDTRHGKLLEMEAAQVFSEKWDHTQAPRLQDWLMMGVARYIPELLPMPSGPVLNLGAGRRDIGSAEPLDLEHGWNADTDRIPHDDATIAGIWAHNFLEHTRNPIKVLRECERVLASGGILNIAVPHAKAEIFTEDITHKQMFHEDTWRNIFANPGYDVAGDWHFYVHANFILGVAWRNLLLFTQMVRTA